MKLFVIEGIDGAGKSTQIRLLREYFSRRGYSCEYLHFPRTEEPFFGELIARFLRGEFGSINEVDPWLVAMLYAGDRKDAAGVIANWLKSGNMVLLDRYTFSNIAYQCAKLPDPESQDELMNWILDLEFKHFAIPLPDLNIFLDVPFSFTQKKLQSSRAGEDRTYLNGTLDIHEESLAFQKKVREIYLRVAESNDRLCIVNCSDEKGEMLPQEKIFELIIQLLSKKRLL
ncbi:MAG: dTMP kinase [Bacteroidales bacterium]|jgi:dTMP kinase|nr:dTMP kinase [Bacteroidales bacterium]